MKNYTQTFLFTVVLTILLPHASAYTRKSREIFDLQWNTSSFSQEVDSWNLTSFPTIQNYSSCGATPLLGGYGLIGPNSIISRTYDSLPSHNTMILRLHFWLMGIWTNSDSLQINITSPNVNAIGAQFKIKYDQTIWSPNFCGNTGVYGFTPVTIFVTTGYVGSQLTISIRNPNSATTPTPQYGLRDVELSFMLSTLTGLDQCGLSTPQSVLPDIQQCPFYDNKFYNYGTFQYGTCYPSCDTCILASVATNCLLCGSNYYFDGRYCQACNTQCLTCFGSASNECLSCYPGAFLYANSTCINTCNPPYIQRTQNNINYCDFPCNSTTFAYVNGSCLNTCPSPFIQNIQSSQQFCNFPCSSPTPYLHYNGSCIESCDYPYQSLNIGGNDYCNLRCQSSEYLYFNGSCLPDCSLPYQPFTNITGELYCLNPCSNTPNNFIYKNGSCISNCDYPHQILATGGYNYCNFPCQSSEYLYLNGSCLASCLSPYQNLINATDESYCIRPCPATSSTYLYSNGSCLDQCPSPFLQYTVQDVQMCSSPCANDSDYLYWSGSCHSSCDFPLQPTQELGKNYCDFPCLSSQYLYDDGSCQDLCSSPMNSTLIEGMKLCHIPCPDSAAFYYPQEQICKATCSQPYAIVQTTFYDTCQLQATFKALENVRSASSSVIGATLLAKSAMSMGDSGGFTVAVLAKMLRYIKYINISYPEGLELVLKTWNSNYISLPSASNEQTGSSSNSVPLVFSKWGMQSQFLTNFWQDFMMIAVIVSILIAMVALGLLFRKIKKPLRSKTVIQKIRIMAQNLFVILFYGSFGDIVLYSLIQFQFVDHEDSGFSDLSIVAACVFVVITSIALALHFYLLKVHDRIRKGIVSSSQKESCSKVVKIGQDFSMLYIEFKEKFFHQQAFLFFFAIRAILFNFILGLFYKYPLLQCMLITTLNVLMLIYLVFKRPLKRLIDQIQYLFCELTLLVINVSCLIMSIQDSTNSPIPEMREHLGNLIIVINLVFNVVIVILLIIKGYIVIKEVLQERKKAKIAPQTKSPITPLDLSSSIGKESLNFNRIITSNVRKRYKHVNMKQSDIDDSQKINIDSDLEGNTDFKSKRKLLESMRNSDLMTSPMNSIVISERESRFDFPSPSKNTLKQSQLLSFPIKDFQQDGANSDNALTSLSPKQSLLLSAQKVTNQRRRRFLDKWHNKVDNNSQAYSSEEENQSPSIVSTPEIINLNMRGMPRTKTLPASQFSSYKQVSTINLRKSQEE